TLIGRHYLGEHNIVEPLIRVLDDSYSAVRYQAVEALAFRHDTRIIGSLFKRIEIDGDKSIVKAAIRALADYRDEVVIDVFIRKLGDADFSERFGGDVASTLKYITSKDFGKDQKKWLDWWGNNREEFILKYKGNAQ
ncbi:MAG: HEAT repeat domain-containing protein, partial [bacterium]|nr:HEAT repeat domain-containing protein [bacterium]